MKRPLKFTALILLSLVSACSTGGQMGSNEEILAAVKSDNTQEVTRLLAAGADVNARGLDGAMPLHTAAIENRKEVAELLIRAGANVNAKDTRNGWTPLHVAAVKAEMPLVELLIANGADVNAKNNAGNTPL